MPLLSPALRYFLAVARTRSISRAAEVVHVVPSAISRQIQRLEESVGCSLFDRQARGVLLTEAGERLLSWAMDAQRNAEDLVEELQGRKAQGADSIRVGCTEGFTIGFMSKVIADFRERHPGICIQLCVGKPAEIGPWLQRGEVDFGLKYGLEFERDVHLIYTNWAPIRAVLSPAHPLARHNDLQLAQLARHPLALPAAATTIQRALNLACNGENLRYQVLYSGDVGTMLSIAALGDAVVLAGDIAIRGFLQASGIRVLPVRHSLFDHRRVMLMSPLGQPLSRLAAVFADDIVKELRSYSPDNVTAQPADGGLSAGSEPGPVA